MEGGFGVCAQREGLGFQLPPGPRVGHLLKQEAPRHRDAELGVGTDRGHQHPESILMTPPTATFCSLSEWDVGFPL